MQDSVGLECSVCQTVIEKEIAIDGHAFGAPCKTTGFFKARSCTHAANAVATPCGHLAYCFACAKFNKTCRVLGCNQRITEVVQLF